MPTVQEMVAKKVAENKAESLAKKSVVSPVAPTTAPVNQVTSTDATKTQGTNNITFGAPAKTPVPVSTPTSVTQGVTTPTPVAQTPVKTPQVIGEENGQPIYGTKPVAGVVKQDLNLPTTKGTQDNLQYSFDVKDPMNYMGTGMTQEQFKTLPLETQSAYTNAALANEQQKVGIIKQTQYAQDLKSQEELLKKQNAIKVENDRLSMENQAVQDNASVAKAQQDLATLKQNIGFLGQGGRPVQSQQVVDSYDRMLATSNQQYKDMVQIANNMRQMREKGIEFDENNYNAQLESIHNDLKRNVDSVIQQAINGFSSDQIAGMIDSPEALQKLQNKYLDMIDTSVMGMTNRSIANLQTMQEVYKGRIADAQQQYQAYQESMQQYQAQQAEQQATFQKNQNILNKDMSSALGYYVDGNGNPLMSSEGTTIAFKKDMPAPIFDRESGVMVTFEPDANGNPVGITKQIMQPSQSAQLENLYKQAQINKLNTPDTGNRKLQDGLLVNDKTGEVKNTQPGSTTTALDTIKKWEGFRDKAYQDATGTWTLGYGFTNVNGQPVQPGMTMDRGTADELLKQEINQRQNFMNYINVPLSENQKAALSSFEFNLGSGIWEKNAMPILEKINAGDLAGASEILKQYSYSKGQKLQGLVNRRNEEARLLSDTSRQETGSESFADYSPVFKNEQQTKSFEFANRMIPANKTLLELEDTFWKENRYAKGYYNKLAPDFMESGDYKAYDQAKRDFINAVLRKESGATITDAEFNNAEKQYFVQPADTDEVIKQKQQNRSTALQGFIMTSGKGNDKYLNYLLDKSKQPMPVSTQATTPPETQQETPSVVASPEVQSTYDKYSYLLK